MNRCDATHDALNEAALGKPVNAELEEHLRGCSACNSALERRRSLARRLNSAVSALASAEPPPSLAEGISARILTPARPRNIARFRAAGWFALAAALVILAFGIRNFQTQARFSSDLFALDTWNSPTVSLLASSDSVLTAPLRDVWTVLGPKPSPFSSTGVIHEK